MNFLKSQYQGAFNNPLAVRFLVIMFTFGIAGGLFGGVMNNFLHEILNISKIERGAVEFPREAPGLFLVLLTALLYRFCEIKLLRVALLASLTGLIGIAILPDSRWWAIPMIVLWSTGEHLIMPVRDSMSIHLAHQGKEGRAMGSVSSAGNFGMVIGYYLVPLLFLIMPAVMPAKNSLSFFRLVFVTAAVVITAAVTMSLAIPARGGHIRRDRLYFRSKYWRYYLLETFFGARKQVFITFAPYVLIINYQMKTEMMALLYGITATLNIFAGPMVGRIMDRYGYKVVIITESIVLMGICVVYGFAHRMFSPDTARLVVCAMFIIDAVLFVVGMSRTMYAKTISDSQDELTSTLSTGISINHLVSIVIAVGGGVLWQKLGVEALFTVAALFGLGYFFFTINVPRGR